MKPCRYLAVVFFTSVLGSSNPLIADQLTNDPPPPNILLMLADNWAWPHAQVYGDRSVKTPSFDRLARQGALFTHAFCQIPSCSPARAVLLTGQAAHRLSDAANLWGHFPDSLPTYPKMLQQKGYQVGYMTKGWGPGRFQGQKHTRLNPAGKKYASFNDFLDHTPQGKPCLLYTSDAADE